MIHDNPNGQAVEIAALEGEFYTTVLERLHRTLMPRSYLEIGTSTGSSLALVRAVPDAQRSVLRGT